MGWVLGRSCRFIPPLGVFFLRALPVVATKSDVLSTIRENRVRNASVLSLMDDLKAAIAFMNGEQSALLDLLSEHSDIARTCAASGTSPASFYRRVHELRMHLRMFGLRAVA